jgi:hypothetical protein
MEAKKPKLDPATVKVVKQVLAMPPKHQQDMKVGRAARKKKRGPKDRASSSKPQSV